jgi:hypothetical protein
MQLCNPDAAVPVEALIGDVVDSGQNCIDGSCKGELGA